MSSSPWEGFGRATRTSPPRSLDPERGGDVLIAMGKDIGTATRTSPPRSMRGQGQDAPDSESIPSASRFPIGNMPARHGEQCRGARAAAFAARVGIGIGIAIGIGIENEVEPAVRSRARTHDFLFLSAALPLCARSLLHGYASVVGYVRFGGCDPCRGLMTGWGSVTRGCFAPRASGFNASGVGRLGLEGCSGARPQPRCGCMGCGPG
jgi:hypothetical protein